MTRSSRPLRLREAPIGRLIAVCALGFAISLTTMTREPVLSARVLDLVEPGRQATVLGLTTFAGLVVASLTQPIIGVFSDRTRSRLGRRFPYFIVGAAGVVATLYLLVLAPTWPAVFVAVLLIQLFSNTIMGPWQALIPDQIPPDQRGKASGLKTLFEVLATAVGGFVGGRLAVDSPVMAVSAPVIGLGVALAITFAGARDVPPDQVPLPERNAKEAIARAYRPDFGRVTGFGHWFAARFTYWCAQIILSSFIFLYLVHVRDMAPAAAGRLYANLILGLGLVIIIGSIPSGFAVDSIGRRPLVILSALVAGAGILLFTFTQSGTVMLLAILIIGGATAFWNASIWALLTDIIPPEEASRSMGIANIATAGASAAARLLGGTLIDPLGRLLGDPRAGYISVFILGALLVFASALIVARMPNAGEPA